MASQYDDKVEEEIPGTVYVFALTNEEDDEEMNPIISDVKEYELPDHFIGGGEKSGGGVCAYALLNTLKKEQQRQQSEEATTTKKKNKKNKKNEEESPTSTIMTWADCLEGMEQNIKEERGLRSYVPTLSTSRPIDVRNEPVRIAASTDGVKRALLIGIHYEEEDEEDVRLLSCHDDVRKMREFLMHEHGFQKRNILVILDDDGRHHIPTKKLIIDSLIRLCEISEPGDSIFLQFSGHGGRLIDEYDEYDEDGILHDLLATSDYRESGVGPIVDDELYSLFVTKIPAGVECIAVIDPLHPPPRGSKSSALELPYMCEAGDDEVYHVEGFRPGRAMIASVAAAAGAATIAGGVAAATKKKKKKKLDSSEKDGSEKNKKDNIKPKKKNKKEVVEEDDDDDDGHDEDSDEEYGDSEELKSNKKSPKKKYGKKKGPLGLRGDKEEKKKKQSDDDDESSIEEGDDSYKEEEKQKKKKKKGLSGLRGDKEEKKKKQSDGDDESSIEEGDDSYKEEEKQKKKKKTGLLEKRTKKTKKIVKKQEIVESDDEDDDEDEEDDDYDESSDEEEPLVEEPKKKKKGVFGFGKKKK